MLQTVWAELDLSALRHNLAQVRACAPRARVMAMLKADAYGHGLLTCARALAEEADGIAVARLDEAERLRNELPHMPLLLTASALDDEALRWCAAHAVAITLHDHSVLERILRMADTPPLWLKFNSGMNRLGFSPSQFKDVARRLCDKGVHGVMMSHFACADEPLNPLTQAQIAAFRQAHAEHLPDWPASMANSAGVIAHPDSHADWVRPGIMLYGSSPIAGADLDLRPVMTLKARILGFQDVAAGQSVGYGGDWVASRPSRIATVGIGYGDGYPRRIAPSAQAWVNGQRVPLAGRVSMDMLALDVTAAGDVAVGEVVTLWGRNLPVDEVAAHAGTISYELLCRVKGRVQRVIRD
ncbi:alanine racemase [Oceanococcus atlanticus]|uniref:Alanine racemase n=1 Tax=Oceanococcus atlanticus TaxID=1317117 RepID=A0A1Y1SIJ2_9GAMM|nr:alanine racemase [Oceanococcus atlanticus]ORE89493.1 alanine racemase [Oceanococcus atlanticus]